MSVGFVSWVVLFWLHLYNRIQEVVGGVTLRQLAGGKNPPKNNPKPPKSNYNKRAHINDIKGIPRAPSLGGQGACTTESHRSPATEGHTMKTGNQSRSI